VAKIEYVGGIEIQARNVGETARWYADFGLVTNFEYDGGQYGILETAVGPLAFGITPRNQDTEGQAAGTISLTFRVSDYAEFVSALREKGQDPLEEIEDEQGRFAVYRDPEGHKVLAWSP
jgi:predicted enzyme related to lactoylglutathione lyase